MYKSRHREKHVFEEKTENIKSDKQNFDFRSLICVKVPIGHQAASTEKSAQKTSPKREKKRVISGTSCFLGSNGRGLQDDFDQIDQMAHLGPTRRASGTLPPQGLILDAPGDHFGPKSDHF